MAKEEWVTVGKKWCDLIQLEAEIKEHRVYPDNIMPDGIPYKVVAHKCSADMDCNMAGVPCAMAYNNPGTDRFKLG